MTESTDQDPLELLRRSNPVVADELPSASLARVRARVQENLMTDTQPGPGRSLSGRRLRLATGLAGVAAAAAIAFVAFGPRGNLPGPSPSDGGGGGGGIASCIRYDAETLARQEYAFDGTVTAIDGDSVTFAVGTWFRGSGDASVTLTEVGLGSGSVSSVPLVGFEVGGRYLVSGAGGIITDCGYSMPYDAAFAAQWASTFGS